MSFEIAAELVHDLSEALESLVELEGELVVAPPGSHAKKIQVELDTVKATIKYLVEDLRDWGLTELE